MLVASLTAVYFAIGAAASVVGPAGVAIREEYVGLVAREGVTRPKALLFRATLSAVIVLLWPVLVPSAARTVGWVWLRREREPSLFELIAEMGREGTDEDRIPGAVGPFGLCPENPIPTRSVFGSNAYLARLRAATGERIVHDRKGSTGVDAIKNPIDVYAIRTEAGERLATLYVSPYHRKTSALAPKGFRLAEDGDGEPGPGGGRDEKARAANDDASNGED